MSRREIFWLRMIAGMLGSALIFFGTDVLIRAVLLLGAMFFVTGAAVGSTRNRIAEARAPAEMGEEK